MSNDGGEVVPGREEAAAEGRTGQFLIEQRNGNAVLLPEDRPQGLGKAWR